MTDKPLRVVTFNFLGIAYELITHWIHENGHKHVMAVTTPGPISRPTPTYMEVVNLVPRHVELLVSTRMKSVVTPAVREIKPDLIMCFSFPYRLPPELCSIPIYGAVNLHPALLPAYRGPNVFRMFYDGVAELGATLHWIAPEFDTGRILSQASAPSPELLTEESVVPAWVGTISQAIFDGMVQALAGNPGEEQDESLATYAAPFTAEECQLDWREPSRIIQNKWFGLNLEPTSQPVGKLGDKWVEISKVEVFEEDAAPSGKTGEVLEEGEGFIIIQTADKPIKVSL